MKKTAAGLILFLVAFGIYLHQAAPSITTGDSGEFMTAVGTLSLPHAPSYPLYPLLGRAFVEVVGFGALPYRINILSGFLSSLTLVFIYLIVWERTGNYFLSLGIPFLIGWTTSFWANSLVTEVFALNTLFAVVLTYCLASVLRGDKYLTLFVFLFGVGLGNHHILVLIWPAFLFVVLKERGWKFLLEKIPLFTLMFTLGFSVYLVLPLRAVKNPPLNWGNPHSVERLIRTITRKDYGSFSLALGEAPARSGKNTWEHLRRFGRQMNREVPWPFVLMGLAGLLLGLRREKSFNGALLLAALFSGPIFYLFANLSFQAQSEGIMGRFFILPTVFFMFGWIEIGTRLNKIGPALVLGLVVFLGFKGFPEASVHRNTRLAWDYGRAMLRTLPANSILFMDGGDDAFYSLACLHYVLGKRPDVELHDRGGLVYQNIYGDDFRRLTRDQKKVRRIQVEKGFLNQRPIYYSSMDREVLPGVPIEQIGILLRAGPSNGPPMDWPLLAIRSLYPMDVSDYRTRALAAFFPYMKGRQLMESGDVEKALAYWRRAILMGHDVDWFQINLAYDLSHKGYDALTAGRYADAEKIYSNWIAFEPMNYQAQSNYGVVMEKQGRVEEAIRQYEKTAQLFPDQADPLYNIAVTLWPTKDWARIHAALTAALKRNPNHAASRHFLTQAEDNMKRKTR